MEGMLFRLSIIYLSTFLSICLSVYVCVKMYSTSSWNLHERISWVLQLPWNVINVSNTLAWCFWTPLTLLSLRSSAIQCKNWWLKNEINIIFQSKDQCIYSGKFWAFHILVMISFWSRLLTSQTFFPHPRPLL